MPGRGGGRNAGRGQTSGRDHQAEQPAQQTTTGRTPFVTTMGTTWQNAGHAPSTKSFWLGALNRLFSQVGLFSSGLHVVPALAQSLANAEVPPAMADIARHNSSESTMRTSAVLAEIGPPVPVNAMPDADAVNAAMSSECDTSYFYEAKGKINALSSNDIIMMFLGPLAVSDDSLPVKALADLGATHSEIVGQSVQSRCAVQLQCQYCMHLARLQRCTSYAADQADPLLMRQLIQCQTTNLQPCKPARICFVQFCTDADLQHVTRVPSFPSRLLLQHDTHKQHSLTAHNC